MEISATIALPRSPECVAFSTEGEAALSEGKTFHDLQGAAFEALRAYHAASGFEGAVWFSGHRWRDRDAKPGALITLFFGTDDPASAEHIAAFSDTLRSVAPSWAPLGVHERPSEAFCSLVVRDEGIYQVWDRIFGEHVMYALRDHGLRVTPLPTARYAPHASMPDLRHAEGEVAPDHTPQARLRDQLKMAFALHFVQRIIEADGLVREAELAFKKKLFPDHEVEELWLDDAGILERMADQAEEQLATLLGHHEKLALLGAFFAACYSDGSVDIRESQVLHEAATVLGLDAAALDAVLPDVW